MLMTRLDMMGGLDQAIPLGLVYQDDAEADVEPEQYPGQLPNVGYSLEGWPPKSRMRFSVDLLFDSSLRGLAPERYATLRADDGDWLSVRSLVAE